jgi:hypothetical protein
MGKMKLFIYPPPRAGPVQACPSPFDTPHLNISCDTALYPMHGTSHFNLLHKMTGLSFRNMASSISFTNQPIAACMAEIRPPPGILDSVDVTSQKEISCQVRNRFEHIGSFDLSPYGQPAHIVYLAGCCKFKLMKTETTNNPTNNR